MHCIGFALICSADAGLALLISPTHLHMQVVRGKFPCRNFAGRLGCRFGEIFLPDGSRNASCKSPSSSESNSGLNGGQLQANAPIRGPRIRPRLYAHLEIRSPPKVNLVEKTQIESFQCGNGISFAADLQFWRLFFFFFFFF